MKYSHHLFSKASFVGLFTSYILLADDDKVVIISPHRRSIQTEFVSHFKAYYRKKYATDVVVDWVDQGGAESDVRYIMAKYSNSPSSSGIDIFWGGGDLSFSNLDTKGLLEPYTPSPSSKIPVEAAGVPLKSSKGTWYGSALSSFGIFYNRLLLKRLQLPLPQSWEDLAKPNYFGQITIADPRRSSSSLFMSLIILRAFGWDRGWEILSALAANTKRVLQSSSGPVKAVVTGDTAIATAIDFYAQAKILELGSHNLGFVMPAGKTVINCDPIGILKGAPNRRTAARFIDFVLSPEAQRLLILKKGAPGGPKYLSLGRLAVNPSAYSDAVDPLVPNPFKFPPSTIKIPIQAYSQQKQVIADLIGAIHLDLHSELRSSWTRSLDSQVPRSKLAKLARPPIDELKLNKLARRWHDALFRNRWINRWVEQAKKKYASIL